MVARRLSGSAPWLHGCTAARQLAEATAEYAPHACLSDLAWSPGPARTSAAVSVAAPRLVRLTSFAYGHGQEAPVKKLGSASGDVPADPSADPSAELLGEAAGVFGLLASPARLHIVWALSHGESDVTGLAERVGGALPAVSQHLAKLKLAGLVRSRREGRRVVYLVDDPEAAELVRWLVARMGDRLGAEAPQGLVRDLGA
ncbi:hypothetical protein GCM10010394_60100 [Streptomyces crystallinus]|uniref:HTH arsR-type domain-containing protein n=1 Tax=Streptomyces crystallinus TaxID=68191 RepID=A0ABP3RYV0_9ACTN